MTFKLVMKKQIKYNMHGGKVLCFYSFSKQEKKTSPKTKNLKTLTTDNLFSNLFIFLINISSTIISLFPFSQKSCGSKSITSIERSL